MYLFLSTELNIPLLAYGNINQLTSENTPRCLNVDINNFINTKFEY